MESSGNQNSCLNNLQTTWWMSCMLFAHCPHLICTSSACHLQQDLVRFQVGNCLRMTNVIRTTSATSSTGKSGKNSEYLCIKPTGLLVKIFVWRKSVFGGVGWALIHLFWIFCDISSGFQSQIGQCKYTVINSLY